MTTEPIEPVRVEERCDKCGTIRITFDPPLQFDLEDEDMILREQIWAVYADSTAVAAAPSAYFWTEASAKAAVDKLRIMRQNAWYELVTVQL